MNTEDLSPHAHWLLRIGLCAVFFYHGFVKFPQLEVVAESFNLPLTVIMLVAFMEAAGATFILLGGFAGRNTTRIGTALLAPIMIGAIALVHWPKWSFSPSETHPLGGMEFQVTLLLVMAYLAIRPERAET